MKVTANDNYNRNKNVIVFGPSGSGKSYSVAGPQLLQFNSNYVLSDPKGELLQEYGNVLLSQGYKVKVFNLKDRDKSDHYNLFAYIKNEDDILVVTKNLVKNLKEDPTAKSTADPIWEEGMTALLEALIGYVFYELEPEERNMNSVMTLFLMLESQGDGPNSVSQLDLLFDDLSINKPNSFAAKQYVYNAMASLSIATLCYQELHGIAVNFLKSYLAVALQGAVLYLVIGFYPALAGSLGTGGSITEQAWAMLGQSVILLVAVFMSGKFTKAITSAIT